MGRDHTIFAKEKGYVCYYSDPERNPKRKYIGVVFERGMKLPVPRNKPRNRRLGLVGREREMMPEQAETSIQQREKKVAENVPEWKNLKLSAGYQYRQTNWYIGRAAERANVKVREYKRGDRFLAWRKVTARRERAMAKRALTSRKVKGSKKGLRR